jgi:hypothetical protein
MSYKPERFSQRIGTGGKSESMEIVTGGITRVEVSATHPAITGQPASTSPAAPIPTGSGTWFFRNNGAGKSQFCVRFPSGAVQVISTEP